MSSTEVKTYRKKERKKIDLNKFVEVVELADAMVASKYVCLCHMISRPTFFYQMEFDFVARNSTRLAMRITEYR